MAVGRWNSEDDLLGHKVAEFLTSESVKAYQEETGRRSAGQDSEYELTWKRKDRTEVATHVSATFFGEEDVEVAFAIITDLTKLELGQIDKSFRVLQRVRNDTVAMRLCEELPDDLKNTMKMKIIARAGHLRKRRTPHKSPHENCGEPMAPLSHFE